MATIYKRLIDLGKVSGAITFLVAAPYAAALSLYEKRDWPSAATAFGSITGDAPAAAMAARCDKFSATPPDPTWDGVWQQEAK